MIKDILQYLQTNNGKIFAITGNAGAGKTTLTKKITELDDSFLQYSIDYKFIGDSNFRKELLNKKIQNSIISYIDACNQYNWWDWNKIYNDLQKLKNNQTIFLENKYNRDKGIIEQNLELKCTKNNKILVEGALLGNIDILNLIDVVFFVVQDPEERLQRIIKKDYSRRTINEILARFLITEYSETKYYKFLFDFYKKPIVILNHNYEITSFSKKKIFQEFNNFVPIPIN